MNRYHGTSKRLRTYVLKRDGYRCQYCGRTLTEQTATMDHVVPRSLGGRQHEENLVTACHPCNQHKGAFLPEEAGMRIRALA